MKKTSIGIIAAVLAAASAAVSADQGTDLAAGCIAPGMPAERDALPPVQSLGTIRLLTGGIGVSEARAMRQAQPDYPLAMTFVQRFGEKNRFLSLVRVEIHGADGEPVLCATSDGPFMFVDLPPGEYHVSATTDGGRVLARNATLVAGTHRELTFVWPASASAH